jgi:hypothetical protein
MDNFDETAADLFLNWVYRKTGETTAFQNRSWLADPNASTKCEQTIAGCSDPTNAGGIRFGWMNSTIKPSSVIRIGINACIGRIAIRTETAGNIFYFACCLAYVLQSAEQYRSLQPPKPHQTGLERLRGVQMAARLPQAARTAQYKSGMPVLDNYP